MELAVAVHQVVRIEVALQRGDELFDVVLGDGLVECDDLLSEEVPVDDLAAVAFVGFVENLRAVPTVLSVCLPSGAVKPREQRALNATLGWDASHTARFRRAPLW